MLFLGFSETTDSNPVKLETSHTVILPLRSVLSGPCKINLFYCINVARQNEQPKNDWSNLLPRLNYAVIRKMANRHFSIGSQIFFFTLSSDFFRHVWSNHEKTKSWKMSTTTRLFLPAKINHSLSGVNFLKSFAAKFKKSFHREFAKVFGAKFEDAVGFNSCHLSSEFYHSAFWRPEIRVTRFGEISPLG